MNAGGRIPGLLALATAALLVAGCDSGEAGATASPLDTGSPTATADGTDTACTSFEPDSVVTISDDWLLSEAVVIGGEPGSSITVVSPVDGPSTVAGGQSVEVLPFTPRQPGVVTVPPVDLDPEELQLAIGERLPIDGTVVDGGSASTSEPVVLSPGGLGSVYFRGARQLVVEFSGSCPGAGGDRVPVTGTATLYAGATSGSLDCGGDPPAAGPAAQAAVFCGAE